MDKLIYGTLVLHAEHAVPAIEMPVLAGLVQRIGSHVVGRFNGSWTETTDQPITEVFLPQRYKRLSVTVDSEAARVPLLMALEGLDALYPDARQLYKLNRLLADLSEASASPFTAVVNIASAVQDGTPTSGSFYLLSLGTPLYFNLVFDTQENSVQLIWATFDFKADMQRRGLFRYVFFPLPTVIDRPVFLHTQNLCARWWKLIKNFGSTQHGFLKASNALELLLFKDPNVETSGGTGD